MNFLIVWVTFSAMAVLALIAVLVWAVRSKQFSNQDRARYLALDRGYPGDGTRDGCIREGCHGRGVCDQVDLRVREDVVANTATTAPGLDGTIGTKSDATPGSVSE